MNNKNEIFMNNEKLIYYVIKKHFPHLFYDIDKRNETYQIGSIGLLKAIDKFDASFGTAFSTYACPMIWGEIKRYYRDNHNDIHYSRKIIDIANKLITNYYENYSDIDCETYLNDAISKLDISPHEKIAVKNYHLGNMSLDATVYHNDKDNSNVRLDSLLSDKENIEDIIGYNLYIDNIKHQLAPREQEILNKLLAGERQTQIANTLGISQAQVSRLELHIKFLTIKELFNSGYYNTSINLLYDLCKGSTDTIFKQCFKYHIDLSKCPKNILEKRDIIVSIENKNIKYSKKVCQTLIIKSVIKLILEKCNVENHNSVKSLILQLLIKTEYNNSYVQKYVLGLTKAQVKSYIDLAKKHIIKYNLCDTSNIVINDLPIDTLFVSAASSIKQSLIAHNIQKIKDVHPYQTSQNLTSNNIVSTIINILNQLKTDNLSMKFQL